MSADSPSDRLRTARAGFDDRLVKPVETATLDALLQRVARDLLPDAWPAMCVVHLFAVREPAVEV
ncbi:hypothetical protein CUJ89_36410 [Burkholderia pyrrocinia]|uniref:Response regulatory domain-containing protein n=1 Tax=Burkholderia pyrrocinia TaxID=60550 RepID=A0A2Z5N8J8_BURPY|nr:hypothetical protein [Burkholderia pyrrocinia]AXF25889.1 hypothetical protein CUJ89_36410 [Burkholderia pyrrocinia]